MSQPIQTIKGTKDILPVEAARWRHVERLAGEVLHRYRYEELRTPVYEATELFARGIGENTDIVGKEMFTFQDRGGRSLTLRPENTAGVARAYIQHKLYTGPSPQKLWYAGPMFRAENVQAGRQRQFHQLGVECLGSEDPRWDAEAIVLAAEIFESLGLAAATGAWDLELNSVGCAGCRPTYREALQAWLRQRVEALCADCTSRTERNPLRVLDCKVPACREVLAEAPLIDAALCEGCVAALVTVTTLLEAAGLSPRRNARLVRGLDYYSRTVFEFVTRDARLGAQSTICAGGRYDGLVAELGGPPTPAVGWALGMERLLTLLPAELATAAGPAAVLLTAPGTPLAPGFGLARALRALGVALDLAPGGKLDKQFKHAERLGARFAIVLGEQELAEGAVTLKDLRARTQERLPLDAEALAARLSLA
ncbi:MAG: histidine--tRNA ligase [Candidatus Sericytochromatia bacterium]|nr:histidine--tRNA ligase [Candidatus Sericytochromatia bacterium]